MFSSKNYIKIGVLCCFGFTTSSISEEVSVYKTTDENGQVIFTDKPYSKHSQKISVTPQNSVKIIAPPKASSISSASKDVQERIKINITSPVDQETIRNNQGTFSVDAQTSSPIPFNYSFKLIVDDQSFTVSATPNFTIENLERGEHTIKIELSDDKGKVIASSSENTIYIHRASLKRTAEPF